MEQTCLHSSSTTFLQLQAGTEKQRPQPQLPSSSRSDAARLLDSVTASSTQARTPALYAGASHRSECHRAPVHQQAGAKPICNHNSSLLTEPCQLHIWPEASAERRSAKLATKCKHTSEAASRDANLTYTLVHRHLCDLRMPALQASPCLHGQRLSACICFQSTAGSSSRLQPTAMMRRDGSSSALQPHSLALHSKTPSMLPLPTSAAQG